jgi:iron complex transport system substrate-binding protein
VLRRPLTVLLAIAAGAACSPATQRPFDKDDLGQPLTLERPATRVVSLAPSMTELLYAIGAGPRLVGRSKWDEYPPQVSAVPSVGDGLAPNVEAVAATKPDLVLLYASPRNANALEQFSALGIEALNYRMDRLDDVPRLARVIGRLTGVEDGANGIASVFERQLDSARRASRSAAQGPRVVLVAWNDPPDVLGAGSFLSEIVDLAGGRNVFDDVTTADATVTIEAIAARKPDLVVVLDTSAIARLSTRPEWRALEAVRDGRFVVAHGTEFGQPSFRAIQAAARLRAMFRERSKP